MIVIYQEVHFERKNNSLWNSDVENGGTPLVNINTEFGKGYINLESWTIKQPYGHPSNEIYCWLVFLYLSHVLYNL